MRQADEQRSTNASQCNTPGPSVLDGPQLQASQNTGSIQVNPLLNHAAPADVHGDGCQGAQETLLANIASHAR